MSFTALLILISVTASAQPTCGPNNGPHDQHVGCACEHAHCEAAVHNTLKTTHHPISVIPGLQHKCKYHTKSDACKCICGSQLNVAEHESWYADPNPIITSCGAGQEIVDNECTDCAPNYFKAAVGGEACVAHPSCPAGEQPNHLNKNEASQCVACSVGEYKTTIGVDACEIHGVCGAGQYYNGGSTTAVGSCTACPSDTYSSSWTSINVACTPHTACSAGTYLSGASASSGPGSCTACPAGKHNADGVGGCNWHGSCPAGQQPSHLNANSASTCVNCPANTYTTATDRSMCTAHNTCSATESLVGESTTSAGSCNARCQTMQYSGMNHEGWGNLIYLDRHSLTCGNHQVLGGMGLTRFRMQRNGRGKYEYAYKCCDVDTSSEAHTGVSHHSTGCSSDGNGNNIYLDRHHVDCGAGKAIAYEHTHRCADHASRGRHGYHDGMQISYQCRAGASNSCSTHSTPCNFDGNGNTIYFDRHNVECPSNRPLMRAFRMGRCAAHGYRGHHGYHDGIQWHYTCCA